MNFFGTGTYKESLCAYAGMSMYPVLRNSDLLLIKPYEKQRIRVGDIVLFSPTEREPLLVHRVIDVSARGIRTRGDYSRNIDPGYVQPEEIKGKVVALWRNGKKRPVLEGWKGLVFACALWWYALMKRLVFWPFLSRLFRYRHYQKYLFPLLSSQLVPHITVFQMNHSDRQAHMFLGSYRIGEYDRIRERWRIHSFFQFFIHPDHVPIPPRDTLQNEQRKSL